MRRLVLIACCLLALRLAAAQEAAAPAPVDATAMAQTLAGAGLPAAAVPGSDQGATLVVFDDHLRYAIVEAHRYPSAAAAADSLPASALGRLALIASVSRANAEARVATTVAGPLALVIYAQAGGDVDAIAAAIVRALPMGEAPAARQQPGALQQAIDAGIACMRRHRRLVEDPSLHAERWRQELLSLQSDWNAIRGRLQEQAAQRMLRYEETGLPELFHGLDLLAKLAVPGE